MKTLSDPLSRVQLQLPPSPRVAAVGAQLGCQAGQSVLIEAALPKLIEGQKGHCSIAGTSAQTRPNRDPLVQTDLDARLLSATVS